MQTQENTKNSDKVIFNQTLLKFAFSFAQDLQDLCPLSKLNGVNANK